MKKKQKKTPSQNKNTVRKTRIVFRRGKWITYESIKRK